MMLFRREYTDDERMRAVEDLDWAEAGEAVAMSRISPESFGRTLHFKNIVDYVRSETKGAERLDVPHLRGLVRLYLEEYT